MRRPPASPDHSKVRLAAATIAQWPISLSEGGLVNLSGDPISRLAIRLAMRTAHLLQHEVDRPRIVENNDGRDRYLGYAPGDIDRLERQGVLISQPR